MVSTKFFNYNASGGGSYRVRAAVDADTLVIDNFRNLENPVDVNESVTAKTRIDGNGYGLQARKVRIRYVNQRPAGYKDWTVLIPVFRLNRWNRYTIGQTGTFRGEDVVVVGRIEQETN